MMAPVFACPLQQQQQRIAPVITVPAPGYVLVPKTYVDPEADVEVELDVDPAVEEYLAGTTLDVVLSTNPAQVFRNRALLTGANINRIQVPQELIDSGVLAPLQDGSGWMVAAGAVANGLTVRICGVTPSAAYQDIELKLTLEASAQQPVDPAVSARITAIELFLDVADVPRRDGGPAPQILDAHAKVHDCGLVIAEMAAHPLPRTKLVLRRAIPNDFPGTLRVQVSAEDNGRAHVTLATLEQHGNGDVVSPILTVPNLRIPLDTGVALYAKGLLKSGEDSVTIEVGIDNGEQGDYVNVFVDPLIVARWGLAWVYPEFDGALRAGSRQEGDDRNNHLSEAEMIIDTAGFPVDAVPTLTVHRCDADETEIDVPNLANLRLNAQGHVVTATGQRPVFTSVGRRGSWRPFNSPFFFFKVDFEAFGASASTPSVAEEHEAECLRVKYLHSFVVDSTAVDIDTLQCRAQILSHVYGETVDEEAEGVAQAALVNHRFLRPNLDGLGGGFADWVARAKNTYAYFHFSHGGYGGTPIQADFYCTLAFGNGRFRFMEVQQHAQSAASAGKNDFPRHLMFLASCHSAWDPRIAQWLIANRQDCYVIGFRQTITRTSVQAIAGAFFHDWLVVRGGDPAQIPASFAAATQGHDAIEPRLFNRLSNFAIQPL